MKTWPALVNEKVLLYQNKLIQRAETVLENKEFREKQKTCVIAGIPCMITHEQSAKMLLHTIHKEQEELITINTKYNRLGLEREAIIKTGFFRKIIRKIDLMKDLFFFNSCDYQSKVWAHMEAYNNSIVPLGFSNLFEQIETMENESGLSSKVLEQKMSELVSLSKDFLWKNHSDSIPFTGKRKIEISLLDAPQRTKERLIDWKTEGFDPFLVCHRDAFTPKFIQNMTENLTVAFNKKMKCFQEEKLVQFVEAIFQPMRSADPIVYIEDGDWTVIIDQYADFPEEKQVIFHIREHYLFLGKQFGVISEN